MLLSNISVKPPGELASNSLKFSQCEDTTDLFNLQHKQLQHHLKRGIAEVKPKPGIQWRAEESPVKSL